MNELYIYSNDKYSPVLRVPYEGSKWWNALEEALYIHFELTPCGRTWRQALTRYEDVTFSYGNAEFFTLHRVSDNTFSIKF